MNTPKYHRNQEILFVSGTSTQSGKILNATLVKDSWKYGVAFGIDDNGKAYIEENKITHIYANGDWQDVNKLSTQWATAEDLK